MLHSPADFARFQEPTTRNPIHGKRTYAAEEWTVDGVILANVTVELSCEDDGYEIIEIVGIHVGAWTIRLNSPKGTFERAIEDDIEDGFISSGTAYGLYRNREG